MSKVTFFSVFLILLGAQTTAIDAAAEADPKTAEHPAEKSPEKPADHAEKTEEKEKKEVMAGVEKLKFATAPESCLTDPIVLEDLRKHRVALEEKNKELVAKEQEIQNRERAMNEEIKRLEEIRAQISGLKDQKRKANEERIAKLVETLEGMSPAPSAKLLEGIEDDLAVEVMSKVSTQKLGKILAKMEPKRSTKLTELLAGVVQAKEDPSKTAAQASSHDEVVTTQSTKGGEKNDGQNESSAIRSPANAAVAAGHGSGSGPTAAAANAVSGSEKTKELR